MSPSRSSRRRLAALAAAPLLHLAAPARAQLLDVVPGSHLRVTAPGVLAGRFEGTVIRRAADSLALASRAGEQLTVPIQGIVTLEVGRGRSHGLGAAKGVLWGGGIGLGLGGLALLLADSERATHPAETLAWTTAGGATWGALIGAVIGAERWERATLPARVSVGPARRGARVALAYAVR